ncbi:MAG: tyrosine--tRNA ligase, partial [Ferruginibacter sp.]
SDQWGNIVTGTELIRRKSAGEAFAFTCPLITKADGGKFGKSEKGNVWLDPTKTTPYQFYQFWLNAADADAIKYIKIFTFLPQEEINELIAQHTGNEHLRLLQKRLAEEVTCLVHSRAEYEFAVKSSGILFNNDTAEILQQLNEEQLLQVMEGVPAVDFSKIVLQNGVDVVSFLAVTNIFPSKGEAHKMIQGGGVSINKIKVIAVDYTINDDALLNGKYLLVQRGKKNYNLVRVV